MEGERDRFSFYITLRWEGGSVLAEKIAPEITDPEILDRDSWFWSIPTGEIFSAHSNFNYYYSGSIFSWSIFAGSIPSVHLSHYHQRQSPPFNYTKTVVLLIPAAHTESDSFMGKSVVIVTWTKTTECFIKSTEIHLSDPPPKSGKFGKSPSLGRRWRRVPCGPASFLLFSQWFS